MIQVGLGVVVIVVKVVFFEEIKGLQMIPKADVAFRPARRHEDCRVCNKLRTLLRVV